MPRAAHVVIATLAAAAVGSAGGWIAARWGGGGAAVVAPATPPAEGTPATALQPATPEKDAPAAGGPRLVCSGNPIGFGTKLDDEPVEVVLGLRNAGDRPLHLTRVEPTCACIRLGEAPSVLEPGGQAEVRFRVRLAGMSGRISRIVQIVSDDPAAPMTRVRIEGEVIPRLVVQPLRVALKPMTLDAPSAADLDVRASTRQSLAGLTAVCTARQVKVTVAASEDSARVHVAAEPFAEDFIGSVVLHLGTYERIVPLVATAAWDVRVIPGRLTAGRLRRGEPLQAHLVARGGLTWRVVGVESDRKELSGEVEGDTLRVRVAADAPPGAFSGTVTVVLEGARPDRVRVPVTAYVRD